LEPSGVIKDRLEIIKQFYKNASVTIVLITDTGVVSAIGEPTKDRLEITADVIPSPVTKREVWRSEGRIEASDLRLILWELESGGTNYLTNQYFNDNNRPNIQVEIDDWLYRAIEIRSPFAITSENPYWVLIIRKQQYIGN